MFSLLPLFTPGLNSTVSTLLGWEKHWHLLGAILHQTLYWWKPHLLILLAFFIAIEPRSFKFLISDSFVFIIIIIGHAPLMQSHDNSRFFFGVSQNISSTLPLKEKFPPHKILSEWQSDMLPEFTSMILAVHFVVGQFISFFFREG